MNFVYYSLGFCNNPRGKGKILTKNVVDKANLKDRKLMLSSFDSGLFQDQDELLLFSIDLTRKSLGDRKFFEEFFNL